MIVRARYARRVTAPATGPRADTFATSTPRLVGVASRRAGTGFATSCPFSLAALYATKPRALTHRGSVNTSPLR